VRLGLLFKGKEFKIKKSLRERCRLGKLVENKRKWIRIYTLTDEKKSEF
jgi:hypothetical protein